MNTSGKIEDNKVIKLGENHWQTYTSIVIDAPLADVWKTLTDWDSITHWSSTLKSIEGDRVNNGEVVVSYLVNGEVYQTTHQFIFIDHQEFGWSDPMQGTFSGLTDNHRFIVERISDGQTLFIQKDSFKGAGNKNITAEDVANQTITFFPLFNRELKNWIERKAKTPIQ